MQDARTNTHRIFLVLTALLTLILILGQTLSLFNYEFSVSLGLQESHDVVGDMGVAINKGFAAGDTIIYIPLLILGLAGMWNGRKWGRLCMAAAMGITIYWPMVIISFLYYAKGADGFLFSDHLTYTIVLGLISLFGLCGMWFLYKMKDAES